MSKMQTFEVKEDRQLYLINVNGKKFEIGKKTFSRLKPFLESDQSKIVSTPDGRTEYFLERHAQSFVAILDYHQTGELHMPTDVCPTVFKRELEVWGISWKVMGHCCLKRYIGFQQNEASLREFDRTLHVSPQVSGTQVVSCLGRVRSKGWSLLDDPRSSWRAKVFLAISTVFVVLSVFIMAASTHKSFQRALLTEEWEEFLSRDEIIDCWQDLYPDRPLPSENVTEMSTTGSLATAIKTVIKRSLDSERDYPPEVGNRNRGQETQDRFDKTDWMSSGGNSSEQAGTDPDAGSDGPDRVKSYTKVTLKREQQFIDVLNGLYKLTYSNDSFAYKMGGFNSGAVPMFTLRDLVDSVPNDERVRFAYLAMEFFSQHLKTVKSTTGMGNEIKSDDDTVKELGTKIGDDEYDDGSLQRHRRRRDVVNATISTTQPLTSFLVVNSSTCYQTSGEELRNMLSQAISSINMASKCSKARPADAYALQDWLNYVEMTCVAYFTLEFFARLMFAPSKSRHLRSVLTMIDLVSVVVMYVVILLNKVDPEAKYTPSYIDILNCLQFIRLLRFFRLVKDVTGFRVLVFSVRSSWRELSLLVMYIAMAVAMFSALIYFLERDNMKSIPEASWWVIVTMTTVGYGDMVPTSFKGKLVGSLCAISGVLLIAVTVPVFVNNFLLFYEHSKMKEAEMEYMSKSSQSQNSSESKNTHHVQNSPNKFTRVVVGDGQKIGIVSKGQKDSLVDGGVKEPTYGQWLNTPRVKRQEASKSRVTPIEHM